MKIKYCFFLVFFCFFKINAQVLDSSLAPANGDLYTFYNVDTTGAWSMVNDTSGIWNFNSLTSTGPSSYIYYLNASSSPYDTAFAGANLASTSDFIGYNYFNLSSDSFVNLGFYNPNLAIKYLDPFKVFNFPFGLGGSFEDSCSSNVFNNLGSYQLFTSKTTNYCNKVGTLIIGNVSFNNVMLVRSSQKIVYTTFFNDQPYYYTTQLGEIYSWYDGVTKFPMVDYFYVRSNNSWETTWTEGAYYMRVRNYLLTDVPKTNAFSSDRLFLDNENVLHANNDYTIQIYDLSGRVVTSFRGCQVNLSQFDKGIYIVSLTDHSSEQFTQKIIVK